MKSLNPTYEGLILLASLLLFAGFCFTPLPLFGLAILGLVAISFLIVRRASNAGNIASLLGLRIRDRGTVFWLLLLLALLLGSVLGLEYRKITGQTVSLEALTIMALLSPAIGIAEELLFRGYVFSLFQKWGKIWPIVLAALAHSHYKTVLFAQAPTPIDLQFLFWGTLTVGIILGVMRLAKDNVFPPLIVHAVFDIVVYGDASQTPWWVWL